MEYLELAVGRQLDRTGSSYAGRLRFPSGWRTNPVLSRDARHHCHFDAGFRRQVSPISWALTTLTVLGSLSMDAAALSAASKGD